jgi:phage regulator Rha-like protein
MKKEQNVLAMNAQRMTSLEIAAVTGKPHGDVLKAIRKMEPAWEKECGGNFSLTSEKVAMPQGGVRLIPVFSLTKTECLYVATKFNDQARARLVLRWQQLEKERIANPDTHGSRITNSSEQTEQKLLVTEKEILRQGDAIRRQQIGEENAPADGCLTVSDIARMFETSVKALNQKLVKEGVQFWNGGRYKLTPKYAERGLAQDRSFHYYSLDGEKKERAYLVWTPIGMEFIRTII